MDLDTHQIVGSAPELFLTRKQPGLFWVSGVFNQPQLADKVMFGDDVVWASVVICRGSKKLAWKLTSFSMN